MPIKFRCSYCRQFLGISRGRAGDVVDCPTCGRSIRVPRLDGVTAPVPSPELNLQDTKLVRALDELANWNAPAPVAVAAVDDIAEEEIPQPLAEPIPIEVAVVPEPIAVKPPPSVESPPAEPAAAEPSSPAAEPSFSVAAALAELNQMAATPAVAEREMSPWSEFHRPQTRRSVKSKLLIALLIGTAFACGFAVAQLIRPAATPPPETLAQNADAPAAPAISGRITYKTADGGSLPDRGARILILPREREGAAKLSAVGFRAADHPADVRLATAALRALGGDLALADDAGQFSIELPNPGTFHIVVISNYSNRPAGEELDPELPRQLAPYFDQPGQVLGRTKVKFGQVRYKGTGTEVWDHSF